MNDVISILTDDHKKVSQLFSQIQQSEDGASQQKKELFTQVLTELSLHAQVEEKVLYPRLKQIDELRHNAFEAYEEHRLAKQLLDEISALDPSSEEWNAKCKVLKDQVEHHVEEEEQEIFTQLKQEVPEEELVQMGEQIMQLKQQAGGFDLSTDADASDLGAEAV